MRSAACSASIRARPPMWRPWRITRCMPCSTGGRKAPASPSMTTAFLPPTGMWGWSARCFPGAASALGTGNIAVGHVRYGTTGSDNKRNVQPILVNHYKGRMALAHNGNLTNSHELRQELESSGSIFQTTTDSEVIAYIIVQERLKTPSIEEAVSAAMDRIEGAYSLVISSPTKLIAVRDPHGFRPLCMGRLKDGAWCLPPSPARWTPSAPSLSGTSCPARSWWWTRTASSPTPATAARPESGCACLSSSTLPGRTP